MTYDSYLQTLTRAQEAAAANWLSLQQAITTIQGQRAHAVARWWQQAPEYFRAWAEAPTLADKTGKAMEWYGATVAQASELACDTTAARAHLWSIWKQRLQANAAQGLKALPLAVVAPLPRASAMPVAAAATNVPAKDVAQTVAAATVAPVKQAETASAPIATIPAKAEKAAPEADTLPLISSTADSFARSSSRSASNRARRGAVSRITRGRSRSR